MHEVLFGVIPDTAAVLHLSAVLFYSGYYYYYYCSFTC